MIQLSDLIKEYPTVISKAECDNIIGRFETADGKVSGTTLGNLECVKQSTDLFISNLDEWSECDSLLYERISPKLSEYTDYVYNTIGTPLIGNVFDSGYQIQKTSAGEQYGWHDDQDISIKSLARLENGLVKYATRYYTYILYLNDNFSGGETQFFNGEEVTIMPETGKLIFFPANPLFVHQGAPVTEGNKYIMTGWVYCTLMTNGL